MHEKWKLRIISDILFLNVVHNAFSIYIIWRSEEVRQGITNYYGSNWRLHLRAAAVFFVTIALYGAFFLKLFPVKSFQLLIALSFQFLAIQHALSQVHGLSRLYDHSLKSTRTLSPSETQRIRTAGIWERRFHRIAIFGVAIRAAWVGHDIYGNSFNWNLVANIGRYFLIAGTVGVMATCFYRPFWRESNHWLFNLRRVWELLPTYFNPTYIALQRLNHGFEYLAVTAAMERNAKKRATLAIAAGVFLAVVGLRVYFYIHQMIFRDTSTPFEGFTLNGLAPNDASRSWTFILAMVSLAISTTHYYYDSQIFRFSKSEFRDNVLPLLSATDAPNAAAKEAASPSRSSIM